MKTIMQDIAKLAQVSPGTVSNALNNRKGVGKETKERILKIAEELGYFKTQKKSEDKIIRMIKFKKHGYILSDTPFFSKLIESCERTCRPSTLTLPNEIGASASSNKRPTMTTANQAYVPRFL